MKFITNRYVIMIFLTCILFILVNNKLNSWIETEQYNAAWSENFKNTCRNNIEEINDENYTKACEEAWSSNQTYQISFYTLFHTGFVYEFPNLNIYSFFIVILPIACFACFQIRYASKNFLIRESYEKFKKKLFRKSYVPLLIFPLLLIFVFVVCYLYSDTFEVVNEVWMSSTTQNVFLFIIAYILNILFYMATYIHIFLTVARKKHNPVTTVLISFLIVIAIELFLEIVVNNFFFINILNSGFGLQFNIINAFTFNDQYGMFTTLVFGLFWCLLSGIIMHVSYRNKEKFIIDCEKDR